jgi:hypothetical protein
MKLCKTQVVCVCLFFLAALPAVAQQRGNIGIDAGEVSDRFANLSRSTDPMGDVHGEVIILRSNPKENWPDVLAGGEIRFPSDTNHHATELSIYGGLQFHATPSFTAGFHVQVHKLYVPPSNFQGQVFNRDNMELLELPLFLQYKFGSGKHVFVRAEGAPEFRPRFKVPSKVTNPPINPNFDHGYFVRGTLGYDFGKWYAKASYESRYFKFGQSVGNPGGLNNWRSDFVTGGIGLNF